MKKVFVEPEIKKIELNLITTNDKYTPIINCGTKVDIFPCINAKINPHIIIDFFVPYNSSYPVSTIPLNNIASNNAGSKQINNMLNIMSKPLLGTNALVILYILSLKKTFAIGANTSWLNIFIQMFINIVSNITSKIFYFIEIIFIFII